MQNNITRRKFLRDTTLAAGALAVGTHAIARRKPKSVLVWSEGSAPKTVYPNDINHAIAEGLMPLRGWTVTTATLSDPDHGIPDAVLDNLDVIIWWGHLRHGDVRDDRADAVVQRVKAGKLAFIGTHSAHWSKPFTRLMGTSCNWEKGYHEDGSKLDVRVMLPKHPIARGIHDFVVPHTERYGKRLVAPDPQELIFNGTYTLPDGSTEISRQGMTWTVEKGKVFYFQPGHESYPIYFQEEIRKVFRNGVEWCVRKG